MHIRTYEANYREACLAIFASNTPPDFDVSEYPFLDNWLTKKGQCELCYESNAAETFFVLEIENKVLACGGYYIPKNEKRANMVWGMVHQAAHLKGVGKHLLLFRVHEIRRQYPLHSISLDTSQHTFGFFERLGFKTIKQTENAYGEGLHRYDMILERV